MTNKELQEALSKFPPDRPVEIRRVTDEGRYQHWEEFTIQLDYASSLFKTDVVIEVLE